MTAENDGVGNADALLMNNTGDKDAAGGRGVLVRRYSGLRDDKRQRIVDIRLADVRRDVRCTEGGLGKRSSRHIRRQDRIVGREPVPGAANHHFMRYLSRVNSAAQVSKVAVHMET